MAREADSKTSASTHSFTRQQPAPADAGMELPLLNETTVQRALKAPHRLSSNDVLMLQRVAGNQAVQRMLAQQRGAPPVQRSALTVGPANDRYEQEAERIARAVVSNSGAGTKKEVDEAATAPALQRQAAPVGPEGGALSSDLESRLRRTQSSGSSLPDGVRRKLEPQLGADLRSVKVHTDSNAVQLSKELGAKAFTHKNHIYYGAGHSPNDLKLTAHEAVHTIQQGAVRRKHVVNRSPQNSAPKKRDGEQ